MGSGHHHHHHHEYEGVGTRVLMLTVALNVGLTVFEAVIGSIAGSLALIADAVHNLGDAAALVIALIARQVAQRGADERYTFGYERAEIVGAMINLTALVIMGLYLIFEGIERLLNPEPIQASWVMIAATAAVVIDMGTVFLLWSMASDNLNVRAAFLHHISDAATSVAVIIGALVVALTGYTGVDPLLTLLIALAVLGSSFAMLRSTIHILMQGTPQGMDLGQLSADILDLTGVTGLHHVHVWQIAEHSKAFQAHIVLEAQVFGQELETVRTQIRTLLKSRYEVEHVILEFEWAETSHSAEEPVMSSRLVAG